MRPLFLRLVVLGAALAGSYAAAARSLDAESVAAYEAMSLLPPSPSMMIVCHGFACRLRTEIGLGPGDRARLTQMFRAAKTAEAERAAIAAAGQWFDVRIGREAGTAHHVARAGYEHLGETDSQFDCIDSSRNSTTLLLLLDQLGLLKFHRVEQTVSRGSFIDGRWPHATAVVTDLKTTWNGPSIHGPIRRAKSPTSSR